MVLRLVVTSLFASAIGYVVYALLRKPTERGSKPDHEIDAEIDGVLEDVPRITLPWGAFPTGVH